MREVIHAQKRNPLSDLHTILKFGRYPDIIRCVNFGVDRLRSFGLAEGQILPFLLTLIVVLTTFSHYHEIDIYVFGSTPPSRPNKAGLKFPSVRPQKVSTISMKFGM